MNDASIHLTTVSRLQTVPGVACTARLPALFIRIASSDGPALLRCQLQHLEHKELMDIVMI